MKILFIGDIFGRPGRTIVRQRLPELVKSRQADLVIANAENAAAGFGLTPSLAEELMEMGIQVLTTGNHIWDKKEIHDYLGSADGHSPARRVLRPANYPAGSPGHGVYEGRTRAGVSFAVVNLQGRVFMPSIDDPFQVADALLKKIQAEIILVDIHAEATSEKVAMGWYLDGRVTAVLGTHTHIQTADERILPRGTAYLTDVGMTGPYDSIIGVEKELVLHRFLTGMPSRFEPAHGDVRLCAAVIECDEPTGRARAIERLMIKEKD
jgi:hypothetical protein